MIDSRHGVRKLSLVGSSLALGPYRSPMVVLGETATPPSTTVGPWAWGFCRVLGQRYAMPLGTRGTRVEGPP